MENQEIPQNLIKQKKKSKIKRSRKILRSLQGDQDENECYLPDLNEYKSVGLNVQENRVLSGSWSQQENILYLKFLETYKEDFSSKQTRIKKVVFNRLSKIMQKRTSEQCRTHHKKLQIKFNNNIDGIIQFVRNKIANKPTPSNPSNMQGLMQLSDNSLHNQHNQYKKQQYKDEYQKATGQYEVEDQILIIDFRFIMQW